MQLSTCLKYRKNNLTSNVRKGAYKDIKVIFLRSINVHINNFPFFLCNTTPHMRHSPGCLITLSN